MSFQYIYSAANPQPSEHESPPITTRPGPPPSEGEQSCCWWWWFRNETLMFCKSWEIESILSLSVLSMIRSRLIDVLIDFAKVHHDHRVKRINFFSKIGPFTASFFFISSFQHCFNTVDSKKNCRWLDSNRGSFGVGSNLSTTAPQTGAGTKVNEL